VVSLLVLARYSLNNRGNWSQRRHDARQCHTGPAWSWSFEQSWLSQWVGLEQARWWN
jgi:hypothetical protein